MDKKLKIVSAIGVGLLLVGAGALAGNAMTTPKTIEVIKEVPVEKVVEVTKEVPVEKIVYQDKVVAVEDTAKLDKVMDFVEDNFDEDITVDYILFETDAKIEAEAYIKNNYKSLLKDNDFFEDGEALDGYRTSEVSIKTVEDAEVLDKDYEDKEVTLSYEVKIKALEDGEDKEYFIFNIEVPFEDGKLVEDDVTVELQ